MDFSRRVALLLVLASGCAHKTFGLEGDATMVAADSAPADAVIVENLLRDVRAVDAPTLDAASVDARDGAPADASVDLALDVLADVSPDVSPDLAAPDIVCATGERSCPTTPFNNEPRSSFRCRALIDGACPAPDLVVSRRHVLDPERDGHLYVTAETFAVGSPELTEGCVTVPGTRRLLRFNFAAFNLGNENLNVGRPDERDPTHWEFFSAHGHWHVKGWGDLQLRRLDGLVIGRGRKLSFCLEDNVRWNDLAGPRAFPPPLCEDFNPRAPYELRPEFGLSVMWGDIYTHELRCQYIDIGPTVPGAAGYIPDGLYSLVLSINIGDRTTMPLYRESNYGNNSVTMRVLIQGMDAQVCMDTAGDACTGGHIQCDGRCLAP